MEIKYQEVPLSEVLKFFADKFKPKRGEKIHHAESFVDTAKGVVIFKLYVDSPPDNKPG